MQGRIAELNEEIAQLRADKSEGKPLGSAFLQCNLQLGAHVLAQCVSYHEVDSIPPFFSAVRVFDHLLLTFVYFYNSP